MNIKILLILYFYYVIIIIIFFFMDFRHFVWHLQWKKSEALDFIPIIPPGISHCSSFVRPIKQKWIKVVCRVICSTMSSCFLLLQPTRGQKVHLFQDRRAFLRFVLVHLDQVIFFRSCSACLLYLADSEPMWLIKELSERDCHSGPRLVDHMSRAHPLCQHCLDGTFSSGTRNRSWHSAWEGKGHPCAGLMAVTSIMYVFPNPFCQQNNLILQNRWHKNISRIFFFPSPCRQPCFLPAN